MNRKFLFDNISRFNNRVRSHGDSKFLRCWSGFIFSAVRYGSSPDDYFRYEFYKKPNSERNKFITYRRSQRLIKELNDEENIDEVLDKVAFNKAFSKFIKRKWLDTRRCSFSEFEDFLKTHQSVIVKPITAGAGRGIKKYVYSPYDNLENVFNDMKGALLEELIEQHDQMKELNPSSVNTIRVFTVKNDQGVNVVACSLRTGAGNSIIDNLHSGGMSASVDIRNGIVYTSAINANLERFESHPSTNIKFEGFQIPNWEKVIETVKKAADTLQSLRYLGWDVAVLNEGVELIEANHDPAHDLIQISDQVGKYDLVKEYARL